MVVGAGIGGLCAGIGLRRRGWDVTVLERAPEFREVGSGITLMSNGLRGLDALGVGDAVRGAGRVEVPAGLRTPSGRWLSRVEAADDVDGTLGVTAVGIHRAALHRVLRDHLPPGVVVAGAHVETVQAGPAPQVVYRHDGRSITLAPDLVVGSDGIRSTVRTQVWPAAASSTYAGATAWRAVTASPWRGDIVAAITWGRGIELGMTPLGDGRVYWYVTTGAPLDERAPDGDEMALLRATVGTWHDPVPALLDATDPSAVVRTDLHHLAPPLTSYVDGAVALLGDAAHAMVPNLGQGANQAIEDAAVLAAVCDPTGDVREALAAYDRQRRPRSQAIARAALRMASLGQGLRNPVAVALRDALVSATPSRLSLRSMAAHARWEAPVVPEVRRPVG